MNRTILALALIGITGIAASAQAQTLRLSETPPGAIHAPGIGPGYIYPAYPMTTYDASETALPAAMMMPGSSTAISVDQVPVMGTSQDQAMARLRMEGFTNVQDLRQLPDGSWKGTVMQRGGVGTVMVMPDGVVSLQQ